MFSRPKILFLVFLLFVALLNPKFNPYLLFKFLIFYDKALSKQASKKTDFTVDLTWWGSLRLAPIMLQPIH